MIFIKGTLSARFSWWFSVVGVPSLEASRCVRVGIREESLGVRRCRLEEVGDCWHFRRPIDVRRSFAEAVGAVGDGWRRLMAVGNGRQLLSWLGSLSTRVGRRGQRRSVVRRIGSEPVADVCRRHLVMAGDSRFKLGIRRSRSETVSVGQCPSEMTEDGRCQSDTIGVSWCQSEQSSLLKI